MSLRSMTYLTVNGDESEKLKNEAIAADDFTAKAVATSLSAVVQMANPQHVRSSCV